MPDIALMVIDPAGNRFAQLLDDRTLVRDAIPVLVQRLGLPTELTYQLVPAGARDGLLVNRTLAAGGVRAGAQLHLVPVRDGLFAALMDKLYEEAKDYAAKKLWELARQRLERLFRTDPDHPDPLGLTARVPGYAPGTEGTAASGGAAVASGAAAAAAPAAGGGAGGVLGCLFVLAVAAVAVNENWPKINQWWQKNRPEWAKTGDKAGGNPNAGNKGNKAPPDANSKEAYGVFLVGPGEEVICGRRGVIEGTPMGSLHGWGLDMKTTVGQSGVELRMIRGPFATAEEARKVYDAELMPGTVRDMGIANHTTAKFRFDDGAKAHMIDNATRLLR